MSYNNKACKRGAPLQGKHAVVAELADAQD